MWSKKTTEKGKGVKKKHTHTHTGRGALFYWEEKNRYSIQRRKKRGKEKRNEWTPETTHAELAYVIQRSVVLHFKLNAFVLKLVHELQRSSASFPLCIDHKSFKRAVPLRTLPKGSQTTAPYSHKRHFLPLQLSMDSKKKKAQFSGRRVFSPLVHLAFVFI